MYFLQYIAGGSVGGLLAHVLVYKIWQKSKVKHLSVFLLGCQEMTFKGHTRSQSRGTSLLNHNIYFYSMLRGDCKIPYVAEVIYVFTSTLPLYLYQAVVAKQLLLLDTISPWISSSNHPDLRLSSACICFAPSVYWVITILATEVTWFYGTADGLVLMIYCSEKSMLIKRRRRGSR